MDSVSVIIPCFNSQSTIADTIQSVLDAGATEVIVVDDGSTDYSPSIITSYPVKFLQLDGNYGVATARNAGAKMATRGILLFIDSDVVIPKDSIAKVAKHFKEKISKALIAMPQFESSYTNLGSSHFNWRVNFNYFNLPDFVDFTYGSFMAVEKASFWSVNGFNEKITGAFIEDNEFGFEFSKAGNTIYLDKTIEIKHMKYIGLFKLLKNDFWRAAYRAWLMISQKKTMSIFRQGRFISTPFLQLMAPPMAVLTLFNPLFFIGFLICYAPYLSYLVRNGQSKWLPVLIPLLFIDMLVVSLGILYGFIFL